MGRTNLAPEVFTLLETHSMEDILFAFYHYARTQAHLATMLDQSEAAWEWNCQANALDLACEALDDIQRGIDPEVAVEYSEL
ncbi:MAG: hypothetical protein AAFY57_05190 [Cyanobacteria bacterium J06642_2]